MAEYKFVELIFEPESKNPAQALVQFKVAYNALNRKPQQIFALLVEKEISTAFFSGFQLYGKKLAKLLNKFPEHFPSPPEDQWGSRKENYNPGLLEETLRAFLFSLLAKDFAEFESREAMADIIMAIIKLSKPEALGLLGEKLGEAPDVLGILIANGYISDLPQERFRSIISYAAAFESWTKTMVDISGRCNHHRIACRGITGREGMRKVVYTFRDCSFCRVASSHEEPEAEIPREREEYFFDSGLRTFESLLGPHPGTWKILVSAQALNDLTRSVKSGDFDRIQAKLLEIADGKWAPRWLIKPRKSYRVPVWKTLYKTNGVILWQVDVAFDERYYQNWQVIKVWGIGTHGEIAPLRDYIVQTQQAYTQARVSACKSDDQAQFKGTATPQSVCLAGLSRSEGKNQPTGAVDYQTVDNSPMLSKFHSLTTTALETISSGAPAPVFPLDVSEEEVHIIDHFHTPAYILGRSGTGKTTCLIYKLGCRYLSSSKSEGSPLRQLLLTRSRDLAHKLKHYTKCLIDTQMGRIDANPESDEEDDAYTWDGSEENTNQSLFSLKEDDFPLVCTFSYFLSMLENTIKANDHANEPLFQYFRNRRTATPGGNFSQSLQLVDFTTFSIEYWRRFPPRLKKGIQKDLAFIEIMGVIKGSAPLSWDLEPLPRWSYINKRWDVAPNFAESDERDAVYSLYELYEKIKKSRGETDNIDRVLRVMKALRGNPVLHGRVERILDEIYVDEVQDQRPLEIELLLNLIRNPCGIHFAGDTAQSISKDALFRFDDATNLFYRRFRKVQISRHNNDLLRLTEHSLYKNFRSHQGIVFLASFVMEILYTGFPNLVDKSKREIGELDGPKPTLCIGSNLISLLRGTDNTTTSASPAKNNAKKPEFGEERVILVRDIKTRDKLREEVKGFALVLTILQSKGMEFENVFLYNFFTTAADTHSSDFAILEELLRERHSKGSGAEPRRHSDWEKSNIVLCSELKNLYVGVTRVRSRLWILESESHATDSIIKLFNTTAHELFPEIYPKQLIEVVREHTPQAAELQERFRSTRRSSPQRWRGLAYEFMAKKDFQEAIFCFERAEDETGKTLAQAYLSELDGMEYRASGLLDESTLAYQRACKLFLSIGRTAKAAACQESVGDFAAAAGIWSRKGGHEEAAFLFVRANKHEDAANEYEKLGRHEQALATYFHGTRYGDMVKYLKKKHTKISATCHKQYSRLCYRLLTEEKIAAELRATVFNSLGSEAQQERFFRRLGMMDDVFRLYKQQQKYREAYTIGVNIGLLEDSVRLLIDNSRLEWVPPPDLARVLNYLQAEHLLAKVSHSGESQPAACKRNVAADLIASGLMNDQLSSINTTWKTLDTVLSGYPHSYNKSDRNRVGNDQMRVFLDLLVTFMIPELKLSRTTDLTEHPLEFVDGSIEILGAVSRGDLPFSAQLYLGIFEVQNQSRTYITLPWSPLFADQKLRFPIQILDSGTIQEKSYKLILKTISQSLAAIHTSSYSLWDKLIGSKSGEYCNLTEDILRGAVAQSLKSDQFSTNLQALFSLNLVFLSLEKVLSSSSIPAGNSGNIMLQWPFWWKALIQQMAFASSFGQDAVVLINERHKLTTPKLRRLYDQLKEFHLSEVKSGVLAKELYLSTLLQQIEVASFLDIEARCVRVMESGGSRQSGNWELNLAFDVVLLTQKLRTHACQGDFPGSFCENTQKLLSLLEWIQNETTQLSSYYLSILSLYEELIVLLIFLIRPTEFLIPQSWAKLHLPKWIKIPRTKSWREIRLYRRLLVKIVINFCRVVRKIEDRTSDASKRPESLARRSLDLIVISIINMGTLKPLPFGYGRVWNEAQMVFNCDNLKTEGIRNVSAYKLIKELARAFAFYNGKDSLSLLVTEKSDFSSHFPKYGISAIEYRAASKPRHLGFSSPDSKSREINAAYLITQCWRTRGPKFLQKMKAMRK